MGPFPISHDVLRLKRSYQFKNKDVGLAEGENKARIVLKNSLTWTWFRSTAEKDTEDHGTVSWAGALWEYVILVPVHTMDSPFYALKSGSKHK